MIIAIHSHTDDDAAAVFIATKASGSAGIVTKSQGSVGSTSSVGLSAQWAATEKISIKYTSSWGGGAGPVGAHATIMFAAS